MKRSHFWKHKIHQMTAGPAYSVRHNSTQALLATELRVVCATVGQRGKTDSPTTWSDPVLWNQSPTVETTTLSISRLS